MTQQLMNTHPYKILCMNTHRSWWLLFGFQATAKEQSGPTTCHLISGK